MAQRGWVRPSLSSLTNNCEFGMLCLSLPTQPAGSGHRQVVPNCRCGGHSVLLLLASTSPLGSFLLRKLLNRRWECQCQDLGPKQQNPQTRKPLNPRPRLLIPASSLSRWHWPCDSLELGPFCRTTVKGGMQNDFCMSFDMDCCSLR